MTQISLIEGRVLHPQDCLYVPPLAVGGGQAVAFQFRQHRIFRAGDPQHAAHHPGYVDHLGALELRHFKGPS